MEYNLVLTFRRVGYIFSEYSCHTGISSESKEEIKGRLAILSGFYYIIPHEEELKILNNFNLSTETLQDYEEKILEKRIEIENSGYKMKNVYPLPFLPK